MRATRSFVLTLLLRIFFCFSPRSWKSREPQLKSSVENLAANPRLLATSSKDQGWGSNEHPLKRVESSDKVPLLDACRFFAHVLAAVGLCMYVSFSLSSAWQPGAKVLCVGMERLSCTWRLSYAAWCNELLVIAGVQQLVSAGY